MVTKAYANNHPEEYLGRDIFLNFKGDCLISSKDDLVQVRYYDNLKQAVLNRLRTAFGELQLHPNYGCRLHELIGTNSNELTLPMATLHTREALLQEPRIDKIISISPVFRENTQNTVIDIGISVKPIQNLDTLNMIYSVFI